MFTKKKQEIKVLYTNYYKLRVNHIIFFFLVSEASALEGKKSYLDLDKFESFLF